MLAVIAAIIQLIALVLKTKFEQDAEERKRKDAALTGWNHAIASGDVSRINSIIDNTK